MGSPLLLTDGYKFSMAEAGWPLRRETFYYSHRKGGLQVLPFDVEAELKKVMPEVRPGDWEYLASQDYDLSSAVKVALCSKQVTVRALPRNAVFCDREPVFSVTGASSLVSWLEPVVLQWSYRIQLASVARQLVHQPLRRGRERLRDGGTPARSVVVVVTDGEDVGSKHTVADCARLSRDLLASELFTLALVGVGSDVNFEHVAKSMGIPPGCILWERDASPSGLRRAFQLVSRSAVRASQGKIQPGAAAGFFVP